MSDTEILFPCFSTKFEITVPLETMRPFAANLPRSIRGFDLRFSSHRGEFAAITFGKDEVLPRANGPIVSSGTVDCIFNNLTLISFKSAGFL